MRRATQIAVGLLALLCGTSFAQEPLLKVHTPSLTSATPVFSSSSTPAQPLSLTWMHRAAFLDGAARTSWVGGPQIGANPGDPAGLTDAMIGGVRLSTCLYAPTEVDLALPSAGPQWIIGRTRSPIGVSGLVHGAGWFQTSQPQLAFRDNPGETDDRVYIAFGGDRYLEFVRVMAGGFATDVFRGVNGTSGAVELTTSEMAFGGMGLMQSMGDSGGFEQVPTQVWIYHDPTGMKVSFFGGDAQWNGRDARWQVWKITDASGQESHAGDNPGFLSALTSGYDGQGRLVRAHDASGRRFAYTYGLDGGSSRLLRVVAYSAPGGPEVARVEYDYCDQTTANGMAGDLCLVAVHSPCTPNASSSAGSIVRETYYRNWAWTSGQPSAIDGFTPGQQRSVRIVVRPEGMRRLRQAYPTNWANQPDTVLAAYASVRLGYSSTTSTGLVALLQSEGLTDKRTELRHELRPASLQPSHTPAYDAF